LTILGLIIFFPKRIALYGFLFILSPILIFHFLILFGVIPFDIVWGGRLKNSSEMISFEIVSIVVNLLMLTVVGIHTGFIKLTINPKFISIAFWLMFILFLVNTVGNIFSTNQLEKLLFTPLTLLLAIFSLRLALNKEDRLA
jgi:hypothetical protein